MEREAARGDAGVLLDSLVAGMEPLPLREASRAVLVRHLAGVPFSPRRIGIPIRWRGRLVGGIPLMAREPSIRFHLAKRIYVSEQWSENTTEMEYLSDLREVIRHPDALFFVYRRGNVPHIGIVGPNVVPVRRQGWRSGPLIVVVYRRRTDRIHTGYQITSTGAAGIPAEAIEI